MKFFLRHRVALGVCALVLAVSVALAACFFALSRTAAQTYRLTVVIDPGHGGVDGGVTGSLTGVKESDVNLAISRLLQARFEEAGFNVVLTRKSEAGLYGAATPGYKMRDMRKRAEIIGESSPALMISVHQNYFSLSARRGAQVFYRGDLESSRSLACMIQSELNSMPECVRQSSPLAGDYYVLNCSDCPSVIVECGFLSNAMDEALLLDDGYREKLADAIFTGAAAYLASAAAGAGQIC